MGFAEDRPIPWAVRLGHEHGAAVLTAAAGGRAAAHGLRLAGGDPR